MPSSVSISPFPENDDCDSRSCKSDRDFIQRQGSLKLNDSESECSEESTCKLLICTGKKAYKAECVRQGITASSHVIDKLSSDRLSLRHFLLDPASAEALSVGLSANRCIRSLNLGSNLLEEDSARALLEALAQNPVLTKLDLSRNSLGFELGELLAKILGSTQCALREVVLAENAVTDAFLEALDEHMRERTIPSPLRSLDARDNMIRDRNGQALSSILGSCPRLVILSLGWNDLRAAGNFALFAAAALVEPGRLISLELSFNGLTDAVGATVGRMLGDNVCLSVLDLGRNHLGQSSAQSIAEGLKSNRRLRALKLGWNPLGRVGTLAVIRAISDNRGPLEVVSLENTTSAGMEFEAACEAEVAAAARGQWVEVRHKRVSGKRMLEIACEYPHRVRTTGDSRGGPISWMTERAPDCDKNTTYETLEEKERDQEAGKRLQDRPDAAFGFSTTRGNRLRSTSRQTAQSTYGANDDDDSGVVEDRQPSLPLLGPAKHAVSVPVLSVRLRLKVLQEAWLEVERRAEDELLPAENNGEAKDGGRLVSVSFLSRLRRGPRMRTMAGPLRENGEPNMVRGNVDKPNYGNRRGRSPSPPWSEGRNKRWSTSRVATRRYRSSYRRLLHSEQRRASDGGAGPGGDADARGGGKMLYQSCRLNHDRTKGKARSPLRWSPKIATVKVRQGGGPNNLPSHGGDLHGKRSRIQSPRPASVPPKSPSPWISWRGDKCMPGRLRAGTQEYQREKELLRARSKKVSLSRDRVRRAADFWRAFSAGGGGRLMGDIASDEWGVSRLAGARRLLEKAFAATTEAEFDGLRSNQRRVWAKQKQVFDGER